MNFGILTVLMAIRYIRNEQGKLRDKKKPFALVSGLDEQFGRILEASRKAGIDKKCHRCIHFRSRQLFGLPLKYQARAR